MSLKAHITTFNLAAAESEGSRDACEAQLSQGGIIAVIADGAGHSDSAAAAAQKIVQTILSNFRSRPKSWTPQKALDEFARLLNRTLHNESLERFGRAEMISTVAAVAIEGGRLVGLNVGDSRAYLWHGGNLRLLSTDHTESAPELQHVLTRAIGLEPEVQPHSFETDVAAGDIVLLCTDGLSNLLNEAELAALLRQHVSARTLVAAAREKATAETRDDITAVVLQIEELGPLQVGARALDIPDTLAPRQIIDGHTLIRPFNQNERTWIATPGGGEQVVIKFAPREARDNEAIANQFIREIWTITKLQAGFFTRAYVPPGARTLCYCMEYVEAPTLKQHIAAQPLPVDEAVALATLLLDACQFLLRLDLVHGDIKPENILVISRDGATQFKLIDFGSISEVFGVTTRAGTPSYLAPERFHGAAISERTEIFGIGVTLYESLTRQFPYGEIEPFQTPHFGDAQRPTKLNPNLPPWMESVLLRAVAPEVEDRYQHFSELKFDLENPAKVKPFIRPGAPLLETNPLLFYKTGFFILLAVTVYLLIRLAQR